MPSATLNICHSAGFYAQVPFFTNSVIETRPSALLYSLNPSKTQCIYQPFFSFIITEMIYTHFSIFFFIPFNVHVLSDPGLDKFASKYSARW